MKFLLLGGGAREHAIGRALSHSEDAELYVPYLIDVDDAL